MRLLGADGGTLCATPLKGGVRSGTRRDVLPALQVFLGPKSVYGPDVASFHLTTECQDNRLHTPCSAAGFLCQPNSAEFKLGPDVFSTLPTRKKDRIHKPLMTKQTQPQVRASGERGGIFLYTEAGILVSGIYAIYRLLSRSCHR